MKCEQVLGVDGLRLKRYDGCSGALDAFSVSCGGLV